MTTAVLGQETVVRGQEFTWAFTLDGAGTIAGATVTANIRRKGSPQVLLAGLSLSIADAANRLVTLTLTETQTAMLAGDPNDPTKDIPHVLDVTVVLSTVTSIFGPLVFDVRTPA